MSDYPNAIPYFVDESRVFIDQNTHSAIVIHGTGGNADQTVQQLGDFFRTTPAMTSVHYGIDRTGNVAQYALEKDGAAGNCCLQAGHDTFWDQFGGDNLNIHTISIEHVNDITNSLPLTDVQKQASFKLIAYLCKKYNIATDHIKSHASIAPIDRARCPGPAYPWNELFTFLGGNMLGVPTNWKDDGKTLTAPNGVAVVRGFRDHVLNNNWQPNNVPLEPEEAANPVEEGFTQNPSGGTRQLFNDCELGWTTARGVYEVGIGNELRFVRADRDKAKAEIVTLRQQLAIANTQITTLKQQLDANSQAQHIKELEDGVGQIEKIVSQLL